MSEMPHQLQPAMKTVAAIAASVETVVRGKHEQVLLALVPMIAGGHLLLQDVPGVGKSTLAQALGQSIGASYSRIQFTSDLLPADILGVNVYEAATGEFRFRRGPIFANVVMADEINRASPKTQSALLEAMNDRRISIDGMTWELPDPFFVIATQNPIEYTGTYPLPESELDRFQLCTGIGYPDVESERQILTERPVRQHSISCSLWLRFSRCWTRRTRSTTWWWHQQYWTISWRSYARPDPRRCSRWASARGALSICSRLYAHGRCCRVVRLSSLTTSRRWLHTWQLTASCVVAVERGHRGHDIDRVFEQVPAPA